MVIYCVADGINGEFIWQGAFSTLEKALSKVWDNHTFIFKWEIDKDDEPSEVISWDRNEYWYPKLEDKPNNF